MTKTHVLPQFHSKPYVRQWLCDYHFYVCFVYLALMIWIVLVLVYHVIIVMYCILLVCCLLFGFTITYCLFLGSQRLLPFLHYCSCYYCYSRYQGLRVLLLLFILILTAIFSAQRSFQITFAYDLVFVIMFYLLGTALASATAAALICSAL